MSAQPGVLEAPQEHLDLMTLAAATSRGSRLRTKLQQLSAAAVNLMEQHVACDLTVTIGFGNAFVAGLSPRALPKVLRAMPRFAGDEFDPAQTQADLVLQIGSNVKFANHAAGKALLALLRDAFVPQGHHQGFGCSGSRGVLGFIDGTANPGMEDRPSVALIADDDAAFRDGSYMVFRKIREDVAAWDALSLKEQEDAVGRRKVDSAEYDDAPPNSHQKKSDVKMRGRAIRIYRRSYPFWSAFESGLLFISYQADLSQYETIKKSMLSASHGGHDRLEDIYHAVDGGYYFMPPRADHGFVGDFLFK